MRITEFTVGTSRTINLGNFESLRIEASVTIDVDGDIADEFTLASREGAQAELRKLMEDTYRAQTKQKTGAAA